MLACVNRKMFTITECADNMERKCTFSETKAEPESHLWIVENVLDAGDELVQKRRSFRVVEQRSTH